MALREDCPMESIPVIRMDPYFNRAPRRFCSHQHTPYDRTATETASVITPSIAYIGWEIFTEYAEKGANHLRHVVTDVIDRLLGDKTLTTNLPSCGVTSVAVKDTADGTRLIHQLVYAIPKVRGGGVEIIEDLPFTPDVTCTLKTPAAPKRVYLAPTVTDLPFTYEEGKVTYTVPSFSCSAMVVVEL